MCNFILLILVLSASSCVSLNYCKICQNHTLCKYSPGPAEECENYDAGALLSEHDIESITNKINERRNFISVGHLKHPYLPSAANMMKVEWSPELAEAAQRWADQCDPHTHLDIHDECRDLVSFEVGQNIATVVGPTPGMAVRNFVETWFMQSLHYNGTVSYYNQSNDKWTQYFTQLIWAETRLVGCGRAKFTTRDRGIEVNRLICNIGPRGNLHGRPIYAVGIPGTQCREGSEPDLYYTGLCKTMKIYTYFHYFNNRPLTTKSPFKSLLRIRNFDTKKNIPDIDPIQNTVLYRGKSGNGRNQRYRHIFDTLNENNPDHHMFHAQESWDSKSTSSQDYSYNIALRAQDKQGPSTICLYPGIGYPHLCTRKCNPMIKWVGVLEDCTRKDDGSLQTQTVPTTTTTTTKPHTDTTTTRTVSQSTTPTTETMPIQTTTPAHFTETTCSQTTHDRNGCSCSRTASTTPRKRCNCDVDCQCIDGKVYAPRPARYRKRFKATTTTTKTTTNTKYPIRKAPLHHERDEESLMNPFFVKSHNDDFLEKRNVRKVAPRYHFIKKRNSKDSKDGKPFWQVDDYKSKAQVPVQLKTLRYTTLSRHRKSKTKTTSMKTKSHTTNTEPITLQPKNMHGNSDKQSLREKYLSFDDLISLRKNNPNMMDNFEISEEAENNFRKQNAQPAGNVSTNPTYPPTLPYKKVKYCTRKLTCTWTARTVAGGHRESGGSGGKGSRTPPGFVEGCTRTSTCTRDYLERNRKDSLDSEKSTDEDYCERKSLNKKRSYNDDIIEDTDDNETINLETSTEPLFSSRKVNQIINGLCICDDSLGRIKRQEHGDASQLVRNGDTEDVVVTYGDLYYTVVNRILNGWANDYRSKYLCYCSMTSPLCLPCKPILLIAVVFNLLLHNHIL